MTGAAQGPERGSPEYRTAEKQKDSKTPRQAINSLHAAERHLLSAQRGDAIARALAEIALQAEMMGASRRRSLSSYYAAKVAALAPTLSKDERHAAIARLRGEESAAMQVLELELKQNAATERARTLTHLKQHYRSLTVGLLQRQRRQRGVLGLLFRRAPKLMRSARRNRPAIRRVAHRVYLRRNGRTPPRSP